MLGTPQSKARSHVPTVPRQTQRRNGAVSSNPSWPPDKCRAEHRVPGHGGEHAGHPGRRIRRFLRPRGLRHQTLQGNPFPSAAGEGGDVRGKEFCGSASNTDARIASWTPPTFAGPRGYQNFPAGGPRHGRVGFFSRGQFRKFVFASRLLWSRRRAHKKSSGSRTRHVRSACTRNHRIPIAVSRATAARALRQTVLRLKTQRERVPRLATSETHRPDVSRGFPRCANSNRTADPWTVNID